MEKKKYSTLSEATAALIQKGYKHNIRIENEDEALIGGQKYRPQDLQINETHRFEGMSNPADTSICYAVSCQNGEKGIIVDAYGVDSSAPIDSFIKKVAIKSN